MNSISGVDLIHINPWKQSLSFYEHILNDIENIRGLSELLF